MSLFDVLVTEAGASESLREQFEAWWLNRRTDFHGEFRFMGSLGFGGKVWYDHWAKPRLRVSCYPEDLTPERRQIIDRTNRALNESEARGDTETGREA